MCLIVLAWQEEVLGGSLDSRATGMFLPAFQLMAFGIGDFGVASHFFHGREEMVHRR
jgi:hypothetical protein